MSDITYLEARCEFLWGKIGELNKQLDEANYSFSVRDKELDRLRRLIGRCITHFRSQEDHDLMLLVLREEARY